MLLLPSSTGCSSGDIPRLEQCCKQAEYAAANAGMLYTAKGTASLLVPLGNVLASATASWNAVFVVASVMNAVAALMAWFALRPMRRRFMEKAS